MAINDVRLSYVYYLRAKPCPFRTVVIPPSLGYYFKLVKLMERMRTMDYVHLGCYNDDDDNNINVA